MSYWEILSDLTRKGKQIVMVSGASVKRPKIKGDGRREGGPGKRRGTAGQTLRY